MNSPIAPSPVLFPRAGFVFLSLYLLSLALCLAVPRALTFLPASIALGGVLYLFATQRALPALNKTLLSFIAGFGALACASSFWSPDPEYSFEKALKVLGVLLAGLLPLMMAKSLSLTIAHKNKIVIAAALLCAVAGALLAFEYSTNFRLSRFVMGIEGPLRGDWPAPIRKGFLMNRSTVFLVLLCFPVMLMLRTSDLERRIKNILSALLIACVGAALLTTNSQTAQIAAILALPMLAFPAQKTKARRAVMLSILAVMLAAPFIIAPMKTLLLPSDADIGKEGFLIDASVPHRFEVWTFMSEQIMEAPLIGHGIEATRDLRAGYVMPRMRTDQVLHPHNAVLQIWVEFGLAGIVVAMGFVAFLLLRLDTMPAVLQRYHLVFFIVLMGVLSMGYGLWQTWLIGMIQSLLAFGFMAARITGADLPKNKNGDL